MSANNYGSDLFTSLNAVKSKCKWLMYPSCCQCNVTIVGNNLNVNKI